MEWRQYQETLKDGHVRSFTPDDVRDLLKPWGDVLRIVPIGKKWRLMKRRVVAQVFLDGVLASGAQVSPFAAATSIPL